MTHADDSSDVIPTRAFAVTFRTFQADESARLLIANSDGTGERPRLGVRALDYNAMFSLTVSADVTEARPSTSA